VSHALATSMITAPVSLLLSEVTLTLSKRESSCDVVLCLG